MISTIIIASLSCLALIGTVIFKPEVKIKSFNLPLYPVVALIGAILTVAITPLTISDCIHGITNAGAVNPVKILCLFISVTAISVFLDEGGFFEYFAQRILQKAGGSQKKLFFFLYLCVSVLTVFTSNDIIILTFTPFIIYFCRSAKIKALPYLIAEFVGANTWSMTLLIGNPTNIYIATSVGIDFFSYLKVMALPALLSGGAALAVLYLLFNKSLSKPFEGRAEVAPIKDRAMCITGGIMLAVCTVSLAVSNFIHVEMWLECVVCFALLIIIALIICAVEHKRPMIIARTLRRLPYALIPFVLSMFVISLSLNKVGVTEAIAKAFSGNQLLLYGVSSYLVSNLVNNIPMSIIFSSMVSTAGTGASAVYASIIGSNLGALLTPIGALAGIMFSSICKKHGEKLPVAKFIFYGACVSVVSLAVALSTLALMLYVIGA